MRSGTTRPSPIRSNRGAAPVCKVAARGARRRLGGSRRGEPTERRRALSRGIALAKGKSNGVQGKGQDAAQAQASAPTRLNVAQAFIRIRPLLSHELAAGETVLPGLVVEGNCPLRPEEEQTAGTMTTTSVGVNALNSKTTPIGGFTGVLGHHDDNIAVFERTFLPRIATVLRGGTASLFCYGYTGAGKTHTVFGYEGEPGMYALAADEIITLLDEWNDAHPSREPVMLQIRCAEVYNEDVFDLLNGRSKCSLRKDSTGKLMVRGGTKKKVLTEAESEELGGVEFIA